MGAVYYVGDAISVMGKLPEKSVDLVLTSPPFLALRSYLPADHPDKHLEGGSQPTPGAYIDWLTDVVEACARVLAPHGSLCFELGDTYSGSPASGQRDDQWFPTYADAYPRREYVKSGTGWPLPKSLSLIPELFRYTLVYGTNPLTGRTTERWRLRNVIRWVRPNPPVGALGDKFRPATSELMVFCKSAKRFFDLDAVRESAQTGNRVMRQTTPTFSPHRERTPAELQGDRMQANNPAGAPPLDWWEIGATNDPMAGNDHIPNTGRSSNTHMGDPRPTLEAGAPPLDWWNIPPGGFSGAHYAVWPPELCVKPIKAMSPEKVCRVCGEPSRRIVEASADYGAFRASRNAEYAAGDLSKLGVRAASGSPGAWDNKTHNLRGASYETIGFSDCGHDDWRPGLVLDPFVGSGTTLAVATGHGRDAIGIDLDERNYQLALERVGPFLLELAEM